MPEYSIYECTTQTVFAEHERRSASTTRLASAQAHRDELRRTREALMKGIYEATEITTPTAFVILKEELPTEEELADDDGAAAEARLEEGATWLRRLAKLGRGLAKARPDKVFGAINAAARDLVTGEEMFLYLLDELTGEPARGDGYPIRITEPAAVVAKLLPAMQAGVRAMAVFNGAAGVARCFGYPAPAVPEAWRAGAQSAVEILKQSSSVEHFGAVHGAVEDGGGERTFRGAALRDFQRLLEKEDPSKGFAGLRRLGDDDGTAVWTALTDQQVAGALEKRAAERRAERRRLEAFVLEKIADDEDAVGAARLRTAKRAQAAQR